MVRPAFSMVATRSKSKAATGFALIVMVALMTAALAACGSSSGGSSTNHVLTAVCSVGGSYTEDMSPFSPNANCGVDGLLYENLEYVNGPTGQVTPMLATGYSWSSDNLTLTFTIRQGVKWSDGKPFSASDVAFTFNLLKQYPDADAFGLWHSLSSVTASGDTVVMQFSTVAPTLLPDIQGTYIVPQHLWANVGDPAKYSNASPVGTGPMKLKSFSAQEITYVKNPTYWQASKVQVGTLNYPIVASNDAALEEIASGQADWTAVFDAGVQSLFVSKDPAHNFSQPIPVVPVEIVPNLKDPLLSQLPVREAISAALDRTEMATSGEAGFEQPASPTGLIPGQEKYLDPKYGGALPTFPAASASAADQILQQAGFTKGSGGIYQDSQGRKLNFSVTVPGDYSDYVADLQIAQQNLQAAGIGLTLNKVSDTAFTTDRATINFQLLMTGSFFGPTPYYYFEPLLHSTHIGGANGTNWPGWKDAKTDQVLDQYASSTDPSVQVSDIQQLSDIMATELPVIPVLDAVQFFEYSSKNWTGWPTPTNLYAIGSAYPLAAGDNEQVILHLTPVS